MRTVICFHAMQHPPGDLVLIYMDLAEARVIRRFWGRRQQIRRYLFVITALSGAMAYTEVRSELMDRKEEAAFRQLHELIDSTSAYQLEESKTRAANHK